MSDSRLESAPERASQDVGVSQALYRDSQQNQTNTFDRSQNMPGSFDTAGLPRLFIDDTSGSMGRAGNQGADKVYAADQGNGSGAAVVAAGFGDRVGPPGPPPPKAPEPPKTRMPNEDLAKKSESLFKQFDLDQDGYLTKEELGKSVRLGYVKGEDAQLAAALYKNVDKLQKLSNDEWGRETSGLTREDLKQFVGQQAHFDKEWSMACDLKSWVEEGGFKQIDADGDGWLGRDEVASALRKENLPASERKMLEYVRDNMSRLEGVHDDEFGIENDGATVKDILGNFEILQKSDEGKLGATIDSIITRTYTSQLMGSNKLYANESDPLASIQPGAIKQGSIGDCYFEAALASMAASNPNAIKDMIKEDGKNHYIVTFPGDKDHPIRVMRPTEAEQGLFNKGSETGIWAGVMEKAFGEWKQRHSSHRQGYTAQEGADGGGFEKDVFNLLTNKPAKVLDPNNESLDATAKRLAEAFQSGQSVTCGANASANELITGVKKTKDEFFKKHAYSVLAFDPSGGDGGTVTVRNPWGGMDGTKEGKINITLKQFRENFNDMTISS